jgi:hypothetical protein
VRLDVLSLHSLDLSGEDSCEREEKRRGQKTQVSRCIPIEAKGKGDGSPSAGAVESMHDALMETTM